MASICLPTPSSEKDDALMKNEHQLMCYFYVPSARVDECASHIKDIAKGFKEIKALDEWSFAANVLSVASSGQPKTMVKHTILMTHKYRPHANRTTIEDHLHKLSHALAHDKEVRTIVWQHRHFFFWRLHLDSKKTALAQDIWGFRVAHAEKYCQSGTAAGALITFIDDKRCCLNQNSDWVVARDVDKHFGKALLDYGSIIKRMASTTDALLAVLLTPDRGLDVAKPLINDLYVLNQAGFVLLKKKCENEFNIKISPDWGSARSGSEVALGDDDDSTAATLLDSDAESLDEKKGVQQQAAKKPGFFKRLLESRQEKRKAKAREALAAEIKVLRTQFARRHEDLQRLKKWYLFSLNLYADLAVEYPELVLLLRAAHRECGIDQLQPLLHNFQADVSGFLEVGKEKQTWVTGLTVATAAFRDAQKNYTTRMETLKKAIAQAQRTQAVAMGN